MIRAWMCLAALVAAAGAGGAGVGCGGNGSSAPPIGNRGDMLQPTKCAPCHQSHFDDWANSMHAQASDDPVFIAMNKRGQRETGGQLGTFCVKCHAPMAVQDKMTKDGLNLASLPQYYKGVTCFFCHTIESVGSSHNNASVNLADDLLMRGEISDPVANNFHASTYSTFHDDQQRDSASMCGSCHDIVTQPGGAHIERTFQEWSASAFSQPKGLTCAASGCHMTADPVLKPIATGGRSDRKFHPHNFPAVDVSLETITVQTMSSPGSLGDGGADAMSAADAGTAADDAEATEAGASDSGASATDSGPGTSVVEPPVDGGLPGTVAVENALNNDALQGALCVTVNSGIRVVVDTAGVGHQWPSGAAQDRRAWAEVIAYGANGEKYESGVVPDGMPVTSIADPDLWLMRDCMFNAQSQPVVNFWEAVHVNGYELPALATFDPTDPRFFQNHVIQSFPRANGDHPQLAFRPVRVTVRIRIQPIGLEVLQDLVASNDLDPLIVAKMPTFDVSLQGPVGAGLSPPGGLEWTTSSDDIPRLIDPLGQGPMTCAATPGFNVGTPVPAGSAATCTP